LLLTTRYIKIKQNILIGVVMGKASDLITKINESNFIEIKNKEDLKKYKDDRFGSIRRDTTFTYQGEPVIIIKQGKPIEITPHHSKMMSDFFPSGILPKEFRSIWSS
jgi:hypothetical protein